MDMILKTAGSPAMLFIFSAALCSVLVSIVLKVAKHKGLSPIQMIAWNYAAAATLCFVWFKPDLQHVSMTQTPWLLIVVLGVLLPSVFLLLSKALTTAGILRTEIAQRLSIILSLTAAYFIFQEQFSTLKIVGVILGLISVLLVVFSHRGQASKNTAGMVYLLLVWLGYASIDVLLKYSTGLGLQFAVTLNLIFICAFLLSLLYICMKYQHIGQPINIWAGLGLGVLNFANIALYVKAHMLLVASPAIVFAGMNILVVVLGVVAGVVLFKERLQAATTVGLLLGLLSVMCLAFAMGL